MLAADIPDRVLHEVQEKSDLMLFVSIRAFAASGILSVPLFLLLKKLTHDFLQSFLQKSSVAPDTSNNVALLLIFLFSLSVVAGLIEKHIVPWVVRMVDGPDSYTNMMKSKNFSKLSDADSVMLEPVIKAGQPAISIVKVKLTPQHDGWTYSYNRLIEYAAMTISFIVIAGILGWLVGY